MDSENLKLLSGLTAGVALGAVGTYFFFSSRTTPPTPKASSSSSSSIHSSKPSKKSTKPAPPPKEPTVLSSPSDTDPDSDSDLSEGYASALGKIKPSSKREESKLVLVVNMELGMQKGKMAAQASHATLACYKALAGTNPELLRHWEHSGQAKVVVKAKNTAELLELRAAARKENLCAQIISDAGRTQIAAGSKTVLGVGPGPVKLVNQVTGHLKLL